MSSLIKGIYNRLSGFFVEDESKFAELFNTSPSKLSSYLRSTDFLDDAHVFRSFSFDYVENIKNRCDTIRWQNGLYSPNQPDAISDPYKINLSVSSVLATPLDSHSYGESQRGFVNILASNNIPFPISHYGDVTVNIDPCGYGFGQCYIDVQRLKYLGMLVWEEAFQRFIAGCLKPYPEKGSRQYFVEKSVGHDCISLRSNVFFSQRLGSSRPAQTSILGKISGLLFSILITRIDETDAASKSSFICFILNKWSNKNEVSILSDPIGQDARCNLYDEYSRKGKN